MGDCAVAGGCVRLISSGTAAEDSMFMSSSASGDDVFLITRQRLLASDQDSQLDLYDARVDGGFPEAGASACAGEGCRAPLAEPPAQPSAASSTYSGAGNPKPKAHHKKKARHKRHQKHKRHKKKRHAKKRGAAKAKGTHRGGRR